MVTMIDGEVLDLLGFLEAAGEVVELLGCGEEVLGGDGGGGDVKTLYYGVVVTWIMPISVVV
jgi:hypothetical protein